MRTHATERYNVAFPGFSIRAGGGMTVVNAPLASVRQTVTDYGHYAEFIPRFEKSKIVGKKGTDTYVYLQVAILHGAANVYAVTISITTRSEDTTLASYSPANRQATVAGRAEFERLLSAWIQHDSERGGWKVSSDQCQGEAAEHPSPRAQRVSCADGLRSGARDRAAEARSAEGHYRRARHLGRLHAAKPDSHVDRDVAGRQRENESELRMGTDSAGARCSRRNARARIARRGRREF